MRRPFVVFATAFLFVYLPQTAAANIYSFTDEDGVTHFSNCPGLDERYKLAYRIPQNGADANSQTSEAKRVDCSSLIREAQAAKTSKNSQVKLADSAIAPVSEIKPLTGAAQPVIYPRVVEDLKPKENMWIFWLGLIALVAIWLLTQRWFWLIGLSVAALASFFAMLASVIHFQILGALGFFALAVICAGISSVLVRD